MPLELRHIQAFVAVAEHRSFTRAAAALCVGQPALSMRIRSLEEELGVELFRRQGRAPELTPEGRYFLEQVRPALQQIEEASVAVRRARRYSERLFLLATPRVLTYWLPDLLDAFHALHPDVEIVVGTASTELILEAVAEGSAAAGFGSFNGPVPAIGVEATRLFADPLLPFCAADHPLARSPRIRWRDLEGYPLICPAGRHFWDDSEEFLRLAGLALSRTVHLDNPEAIKRIVAQGSAVSLLPQSTLEAELRAGTLRLLPIEEGEALPVRHTYFLYRRDAKSILTLKRLLAIALKEFSRPSPGGGRKVHTGDARMEEMRPGAVHTGTVRSEEEGPQEERRRA